MIPAFRFAEVFDAFSSPPTHRRPRTLRGARADAGRPRGVPHASRDGLPGRPGARALAARRAVLAVAVGTPRDALRGKYWQRVGKRRRVVPHREPLDRPRAHAGASLDGRLRRPHHEPRHLRALPVPPAAAREVGHGPVPDRMRVRGDAAGRSARVSLRPKNPVARRRESDFDARARRRGALHTGGDTLRGAVHAMRRGYVY